MKELTATYNTYAGTYTEWKALTREMTPDMMVPDVVLDAMRRAILPVVQETFEKHLKLDQAEIVPPLNVKGLRITKPRIPMKETRRLVAEAFEAFSPNLGECARAALEPRERITLRYVGIGQAGGRCSPPGYRGPRARILYHPDRSINDPVYIGHELGHLLTGDYAQKNGYENQETWLPKHVAEVPAMFTQCLIYDPLKKEHPDPRVRQAAQAHFVGEMTRGLYEFCVAAANPVHKGINTREYERGVRETLGPKWRQFSKAEGRALSTNNLHGHIPAMVIGAGLYFSGFGHQQAVFDAMFKKGRDTNVLDVLSTAGVNTEAQLDTFMMQAVEYIVQPLNEMSLGKR